MKEKNSKRLANISLIVASCGFAATVPFQSKLLQILSGGFEAALVGGLADWFAVTAMFRHPLGIPIPHTALLPKNRAKITDGILNTLNNQWLSKESLIEKVEERDWIHQGIAAFEQMLENDESRTKIIQSIQQFGASIPDETIEKTLHNTFKPAVTSISSQKLLSNAVDTVIEKEWDALTYEFLINKIEETINIPHIKELIGKEVIQFIERKFFMIKAFLPMIGEEKITEFIHSGLVDLLSELKDPNSDRRNFILSFIRMEAEKNKSNENIIRQLDEWKNKGYEYVVEQAIKLFRNKINDKDFILNTIQQIIHFIKNSNWIDQVELSFKKLLINTIEKYHHKIGDLVRFNIEKLSTEEITDLLENKIGKDITWIRVNGAVCGFIIGLVLTSARLIFA
ncbi:DUF445 domain-containing protein [Bacillus sp. AFS055030]|uniref:DUF445 domain-containing protein n=1 Tax=Bacillus sp. AFS055030 TaxID=2033507 RepID=UPI000BFC8E11|nr:DUF445 domain-containing protein [Bacillus sp. AFS055030]PGL71117.1 hypothetical protein CN925_09705 [Bacillus sp. AFS055030]